jgi:hypothetical protein
MPEINNKTSNARTYYTDSFKTAIVKFCDDNPNLTYREVGEKFNVPSNNIYMWYVKINGCSREENRNKMGLNRSGFTAKVKAPKMVRDVLEPVAETKQVNDKPDNQKLLDLLLAMGVDFTISSKDGNTVLNANLS